MRAESWLKKVGVLALSIKRVYPCWMLVLGLFALVVLDFAEFLKPVLLILFII